jgi:glycerophosphoryl diester phosphodiesterase
LTLAEVFDLVRRSGAGGPDGVRLTIETKVEAGAPEQTAPREQFVQVTVDAVRRAGLLGNVSVQSFDWGCATNTEGEADVGRGLLDVMLCRR